MKKRLLFLFSLLLLVGNVVAQDFDTSAKYRIKVSDGSAAGEYVTIGDNFGHAFGYVHTMALDEANSDQVFSFVSSNGNWKVKTDNGEYFCITGSGTGWNTWNLNKTDNESNANAVVFTPTGNSNEYYLNIVGKSTYFKVGAVDGGASSYYHVYFDAAQAARNKFVVEKIGDVTPEPDPNPETPTYPYVVTNVSNLNYSCLYTIDQPHHTHGATAWAVSDALKSNVDLGKEIDANDTAQQFAFFSNDGGTTVYLYHPASKQFINLDGTLGKSPKHPVTFSNGAASYPNTFVVKFDNNHYINVGGERQMIIDGWSTADGGNSCRITAIAEFDPNEALTTALVGKTEEALALTGVGYPVADAEERTALVEALTAFENEATQENKDNLVAKLTAFAASTNVQMPESGKAYIFANKQKNGNLYYFTYTEEAVQVTSDASNATPFVCKVLENGKFVFVNNAGKYLVWRGKNAGTNEVKGYVDAYDTSEEAWTDIELTKVVEGDKVDAGNEETLFGCVYLKGRRSNDPSAEKDHFAYTVIKSDGTYDQANVPFFNANFSSAMMLVEATYPNKPELKAADGLDVAAIATYSAPFATVVPEGVTAWYAQSESDNTVKLTEVEGAIPANTGVVLTSETTGTVTMVPAAAEELATVSGNLLSEAAAAGDYEVEAETNAYVIGKADDVVAFYPLSATNRTIAQGKSFLVLPTASPVVKMNFGGESTAIETVEKVDANAPIYDLSGRRVVNMTNGGVYIQNGKKFIVK